MESIYYVISWLCHRACPHCYDHRFRPYQGEDLQRVVAEAARHAPRIVANLPPRLTYREPAPGAPQRPGSVILAGGEILLDPVREPVLYPAITQLREKYRPQGGVKIIIQTTGDVLTPRIAAELLDLGVWTISISGIDDFHAGLERLQPGLREMLEDLGCEYSPALAEHARDPHAGGRYYHFFGATPELWIGKLWPRGRAWQNSLSTASLADNFCAQWSGGKHFLSLAHAGSEVSIEPDGSVYPCCLKTRRPVGNASEEPLEAILARLRGNPVYEAINRGEPQQMGLAHGWSEAHFLERSRTTLPDGRVYENLCLGCDRFHEEVLGAAPLLQITG